MGMRRVTRLTNAFSKKWFNLKWLYALHFAYYNFYRASDIARPPAMEAGITDHILDPSGITFSLENGRDTIRLKRKGVSCLKDFDIATRPSRASYTASSILMPLNG
jgi:hypothetical protein